MSSLKNKSKTHSITPTQEFNTGDLVFLRDGHNKNNPRELHIIEDQEGDYYLIRKLNKRLRARLYKAHPDEMILAPSQAPHTHDAKSNPPQIPEDLTPQEPHTTKAGRPLRKAARKAHGVHGLKTQNPSMEKKHNTFGWLTEDQDSDADYIPFFRFRSPVSMPEDHASCTDSPTDQSGSDTDPISSDSEQDYTWDSSPEQLLLTGIETQRTTQSATTRNSRRLATSEKVLVRSNAFKQPPDTTVRPQTIPPTHPTDPGLSNVTPPNPSRIPRPTTPSQVNLYGVNDVSQVLPQTPKKPIQFHRSSNEPLPYQSLPQNLSPKRGRSTRRPFDYKLYHKTGQKKQVNEVEVNKEGGQSEKIDEEDKQPREPRAATLAGGYQPAVRLNPKPNQDV